MILDSINLYSSGLEATLALSSAAKSGCAHRRARSHRTLWNQSAAKGTAGPIPVRRCQGIWGLACAGGALRLCVLEGK